MKAINPTYRPLNKVPEQIFARQNGSALLISLVLLTVLTLIGLSSAENSLLEEKMASNTHFKSMVFQETRSEIEGQYNALIEDMNPIIDAIAQDVVMTIATSHTGITKDAELSYVGEFEARARRKQDIYSLGRKALVTEMNVDSTLDNTGAVSSQTQGMEYILPEAG